MGLASNIPFYLFEANIFGLEGEYHQIEDYSCYECAWVSFYTYKRVSTHIHCRYAFDDYNLDGDCLAEK